MSNLPKKDRRELFAVDLSVCCKASSRIVESRNGGFVARGCTSCGKSNYIVVSAIPSIKCISCTRNMEIHQDAYKTYVCSCECGETFALAQVLPVWSDYFGHDGLRAAGDFQL